MMVDPATRVAELPFVVENLPLGDMTTYKFGGPARFFATIGSVTDLNALIDAARDGALPFLVLGRGSNMVVSDEGFDGVVIRLAGDFATIDVLDGGIVSAGGAVPLPRLARETVKAGRGGLEFYVGIPGSVGGAVRMNAGCHGSDTAEWMTSAAIYDVATGETSEATPGDLEMSYRHTNVTDNLLVVSARFRTVERDPASGDAVLREVTAWRKEHQPGGTLNAGSVFKNPPGDAAGRIIDAAGLKGLRIGGVSVSTKHANFFVAEAHARAQDVFDLVSVIRDRVEAHTGVVLEPEIRFFGRFDSMGGPS